MLLSLYEMGHLQAAQRSESPQCESIWVELGAPADLGANPILIGCQYRPPSQSLPELSSFCDMMTDTLRSVNLLYVETFLTGGYNAHNSDW